MRELSKREKDISIKNIQEREKQKKRQEIEMRIAELQLRELEIEYQKRKILAEAIEFWYEDKKKQITESIRIAKQDYQLNKQVIGITNDQITNGVN